MDSPFSVESLRAALKERRADPPCDEAARFEALARRYETAVGKLLAEIRAVVLAVPELTLRLETEVEAFTSPAFPNRRVDIRSQRLQVSLDDDFLLFDPTAGALTSALGQVRLSATRPIPFMVERVLYLVRARDAEGREVDSWTYRPTEDFGRTTAPFTPQVLLRLLHGAFS